MNASDLVRRCREQFVTVRRSGGQIELEALFPDTHPLAAAVVEEVRREKPAVIAYLAFEEQADRLLLESTRRLAKVWTRGCNLDGPAWESHEQALHAAYQSQDLGLLRSTLEAREHYANAIFSDSRREVHHES